MLLRILSILSMPLVLFGTAALFVDGPEAKSLRALLALTFAWAESAPLAIAVFCPFYLLNNLYVSSLWTLVQNLVSPRMRSMAAATQLTVLNIVGLGAGPLVAGYVSEVLEPEYGVDGLRIALTIAAVVGSAAAIFFLMAGRSLREDLARVNPTGNA